MYVPMRRGQGRVFDMKRKNLNRKCLENLEEWKCNDPQLAESIDWNSVGKGCIILHEPNQNVD